MAAGWKRAAFRGLALHVGEDLHLEQLLLLQGEEGGLQNRQVLQGLWVLRVASLGHQLGDPLGDRPQLVRERVLGKLPNRVLRRLTLVHVQVPFLWCWRRFVLLTFARFVLALLPRGFGVAHPFLEEASRNPQRIHHPLFALVLLVVVHEILANGFLHNVCTVVEGQLVTDIAGVLLGRTLSRAEVVASVAGFVIRLGAVDGLRPIVGR